MKRHAAGDRANGVCDIRVFRHDRHGMQAFGCARHETTGRCPHTHHGATQLDPHLAPIDLAVERTFEKGQRRWLRLEVLQVGMSVDLFLKQFAG